MTELFAVVVVIAIIVISVKFSKKDEEIFQLKLNNEIQKNEEKIRKRYKDADFNTVYDEFQMYKRAYEKIEKTYEELNVKGKLSDNDNYMHDLAMSEIFKDLALEKYDPEVNNDDIYPF